MTKEEMFDWLDSNNASILRHPEMSWTDSEGNTFSSNFTLTAKGTQFAATPTLAEAIEGAAKVMKEKV